MELFKVMAEALAHKYGLKRDGFSLLYEYYEGEGIYLSVSEKEFSISVLGVESPYEKKPYITAVSILLTMDASESIFCASKKLLTATQRSFLKDLNILTGGELQKEASSVSLVSGPMQGAAKRLTNILKGGD